MIKDLTHLSWSMGQDFSGSFTQTSLGAYYKTIEKRLSYLEEVGLVENKRV